MPRKEFEQYELSVCSLIFEQYCTTAEDDNLIQGYYVQVETDDIISE
jgi:hypothetical protein